MWEEEKKKAPEKPHYLRGGNRFINEHVKIEKMRNTPSSTAAAGSGSFHGYRKERRKENYRLQSLAREAKQEKDKERLEAKRENNRKEAEERTSKKSQARLKKREHKKALKKAAKEETAEKEVDRV